MKILAFESSALVAGIALAEDENLIAELHLLIEKYEAMPARISNDINIRAELKNLQKMN